MNDLRDYTTEQLQAEIERRNRVIEPPRKVDNPDWTKVIEGAEESIADCIERIRRGASINSMMLPSRDVLEAIYGDGIVEWLRGIRENVTF